MVKQAWSCKKKKSSASHPPTYTLDLQSMLYKNNPKHAHAVSFGAQNTRSDMTKLRVQQEIHSCTAQRTVKALRKPFFPEGRHWLLQGVLQPRHGCAWGGRRAASPRTLAASLRNCRSISSSPRCSSRGQLLMLLMILVGTSLPFLRERRLHKVIPGPATQAPKGVATDGGGSVVSIHRGERLGQAA